MDYTDFAARCIADLKILQEKFQTQYNLDWYEDWFYNQATGLLTFSTGEKELNFKYSEVGSFSQKSNTWKWSWDNENTLDKVRGKTRLVREFGEKCNFPKLTEGCFTSDEFEAWEFTAIAVKLMNGIGVYRPVSDQQLQIFLVLTGFIEREAAQSIKDKYVACGAHEYRRIAFVCQHLNHTSKPGFHEAFETVEDMELADDDDFQAWCDECETVRQKESEWNEKSMAFAGIKIVCEQCYFEIKDLNRDRR